MMVSEIEKKRKVGLLWLWRLFINIEREKCCMVTIIEERERERESFDDEG